MSTAATILQLSIGGVLLLASGEKSYRFRSFVSAISNLTLVPRGLVLATALFVVSLEAGLAVALLTNQFPIVAAATALVLFVMFSLVIAVSLARGKSAPCHCFGPGTSGDGGLLALIRAISLALLSAVFLHVSAEGRLQELTLNNGSRIALTATLIVLAIRFSSLLPEGWLMLRGLQEDSIPVAVDSGLPIGIAAPEFHALDKDGSRWASSSPSAGERVLTFLSPTCGSCRKLVPRLEQEALRHSDREFLIICLGDESSCGALLSDDVAGVRVLLDESGRLGHAFRVPTTPFIYRLDPDGVVLFRGVPSVRLGPSLRVDLAGRQGRGDVLDATF
jgi:Methylamine utilisation protein MauE/AhpC/TSA family